ncbi:MAG: transport-associated protein [Segetibacter sp.]|jgi:osmotically-inducible protein OsmY|nr:transport-associated protein [Segetibacter sp.]
MRFINYKALFPSRILMVVILLNACTPKDTTIKADLLATTKEQKDFAGVRFTVDKGVVTLSGECPTQMSKDKIEKTAKQTFGVKDVKNNIVIAPVVIGTDQQLKQAVDSLLKDYPGVEAITKDSVVYLQGKLADEQVMKLKDGINALKPKMVDAKLTSR